MLFALAPLCALVIAEAAASPQKTEKTEAPVTFTPLFNGTDTAGWHGVGPDGSASSAGAIDRHWSVSGES